MLSLHPFFRLQRRKVNIQFVGSELNEGNLTTYTFTSLALPRRMSNNKRVIVAAFHGEDSATAFSISSATFGGTSMTARGTSGTALNSTVVRFFTLEEDSLASGAPACTFSEAVTSAGVGLWVVDGLRVPDYTNIDDGAFEFTGTQNHGNGGLLNDAWFWAGTSADASPSGVVSHVGPHGFKATGDYNNLGTEMSIAGTSFLHGQYGTCQRINENFAFTGAGNCSDVMLRIRESTYI